MNSLENLANKNLSQKLSPLEEGQFTGWVQIKNGADMEWKIYICLSRIIWADGGFHPNRFWLRHLTKYCPQVKPSEINIADTDKLECWNYHVLSVLQKKNIIKPEQATTIIQNQITDILFDIIQTEENVTLDYSIHPASANYLWESGLSMSLTLLTIKQALGLLKPAWSNWCQRGFRTWSPNLAPIVKEPQQLGQEVSPVVYQNFIRLFNGKLTLRDLASRMNQDLIKLVSSLTPYLLKGWLALIDIPDIPDNQTPFRPETNTNSKVIQQSLIACIDDSPQICQTLKLIINKLGYGFLGIQQPLQALPKLITANPDLIFLDLSMPVMNGYEICTQIRRVAKLQNVPVIILTSNDGIVDRMRAKVVGASAFLSKPITIEKVINTLNKFLLVDEKTLSLTQSQSGNSEDQPTLIN